MMIKKLNLYSALVVTVLSVTTLEARSDDATTGPDIASSTSAAVTSDAIIRFSPRARADVVQEIARHWGAATAAGIDDALKIQHFFAEIAGETGGMSSLDEDLNYSAAGLMRTWPKRFTPALASRYAHDPVALANFVYAGRNGNVSGTDDGWVYRGGGLIQLTGRGNYRQRGHDLGLGGQLEAHPDLVRTPALAFSTACSYWKFVGASKPADQDDVAAVRYLINGGYLGLPAVKIWLGRAKHVFRAVEVAESDQAAAANAAEENRAILSQLESLGYAPPTIAAGVDVRSAVQDALKKFQKNNGLPETGTLDDDTLYKLTDPRNSPKE